MACQGDVSRRVRSWTLLCAQARRIGAPSLLGLPLACALMAALGVWARAVLASEEASLLTAALGQLYVIACGIFAATLLTGDAISELHEATPAGFRAAQLARLVLIAVATALGGVLLCVPLSWDGGWPSGAELATLLAGQIGAAFFACLVAFCVAASSGSAQAAVLAALSAWFFLTILWDPNAGADLALMRGVPLAGALLAAAWATHRLGNAERTVEIALRAEAER